MLTLFWILVALVFAVAATLTVAPLRRGLISDRVLAVYRKLMPPMSQTEREALEAQLDGSGRVLIRASGTEPVLRLMVEAREAAVAREGAERLAEAVRSGA